MCLRTWNSAAAVTSAMRGLAHTGMDCIHVCLWHQQLVAVVVRNHGAMHELLAAVQQPQVVDVVGQSLPCCAS